MIKLDLNQVSQAKKLIDSSEKIFLASHISPDGDNLGSLLSLSMGLINNGHKVKVLKVDDLPDMYRFLPGVDLLEEWDEDEEVDLFIALDCGDVHRLGQAEILFNRAKNTINIDHHLSNTGYGDVNIVHSNASSTGEIVFELLSQWGVDIDRDMATCLYTALSTDTGSFIYSSTSARTYEIASILMDKGIDLNEIAINLYQSNSIESRKLFIAAMNTLEFHMSNRVSLIYVDQSMLDENKAQWQDTEGFIEFIRNIDGVELAIFLKEYEKDLVKVSLRSKEYVNASELCKLVGGGGHKRAAGATVEASLSKVKKTLLDEIEKIMGD